MPLSLPLVIVGLLATIVMSYHVTIGTLKTKLKLNIGRQEGGEFLLLSVAAGEESDERGRATNFLQSLNTVSMEGEIIDWYDDEGKVVCPLPRRFVHSHNLLHRGIGVLLRRQTNEVYIHKRANSKRTWPGLLDAMIGGIGVSGSSSAETLVRDESAFVPSGLQCFRFIESNFLG